MDALYRTWLRITKNPILMASLRRITWTLLFVGCLGGLAYWYIVKQTDSKETSLPTSASLSGLFDSGNEANSEQSGAELELSFQRLILGGDRNALKAFLSSRRSSTARTDDPAIRMDKLRKRSLVATRMEELAETEADKDFLKKVHLWTFVEYAMVYQANNINSLDQLSGIDELMAEAKTSQDEQTRDLAEVVRIVSGIRRHSIEAGTAEELARWAEGIRQLGLADPHNEYIAVGIYEFLGIYWEYEEFDSAYPLVKAYYDGFRSSNSQVVKKHIEMLEPLLDDRKSFFDNIAEEK